MNQTLRSAYLWVFAGAIILTWVALHTRGGSLRASETTARQAIPGSATGPSFEKAIMALEGRLENVIDPD